MTGLDSRLSINGSELTNDERSVLPELTEER